MPLSLGPTLTLTLALEVDTSMTDFNAMRSVLGSTADPHTAHSGFRLKLSSMHVLQYMCPQRVTMATVRSRQIGHSMPLCCTDFLTTAAVLIFFVDFIVLVIVDGSLWVLAIQHHGNNRTVTTGSTLQQANTVALAGESPKGCGPILSGERDLEGANRLLLRSLKLFMIAYKCTTWGYFKRLKLKINKCLVVIEGKRNVLKLLVVDK